MKPSELVSTLNALMLINRPSMIWGPPGVGKSDIVAQVAKDSKRELRDVRMSQMDPTDIKGFPAPNTKAKLMEWLPPDFLPTDPKSKGILFLDELVSAPTAVQASAYQLILNRRVGNYELPKGWIVVAAGNRMGDGSVTYRMPKALANRFFHLDLEPDVDEFIDYTLAAGWDHYIPAFMKLKANLMHSPTVDAEQPAFPSPRTWQYVDEVLKKNLDKSIEHKLVAGAIGVGPAAEFMAFMRIARELPGKQAIILNPDTAPLPTNVEAKHAVTMMLVKDITETMYPAAQKYVNRMETEFQAIFNIGALKANPKIEHLPEFLKWGTENHQVIMGDKATGR
jgi:MoxR-like ATPase